MSRRRQLSGSKREYTMMRCGVVVSLLAIGAATLPGQARGQDEASALAAIEQIFEGMRTANPDLVQAVFAPDARFAMLDTRNGPTRIQVQAVDGWIDGIANSAGSWNEQIYDVEVRVDGAMASAWTPYTFYLDGEISHCGINSIELLHDGESWRVTQLSDTRRRGECPDPLGGAEGPSEPTDPRHSPW